MAQVGSQVTGRVVELLTGDGGLAPAIAALSEAAAIQVGSFSAEQVLAQNIAQELAERSAAIKYPAVHVYCDKLTNLLREKFRRFSGKAHVVIEMRVSQDRLEGLEQKGPALCRCSNAGSRYQSGRLGSRHVLCRRL